MPSKQRYTNVLGQEFEVDYKNVELERALTQTIQIPVEMSLSEAAHWIQTRLKEEEKIVSVSEQIAGFPIDVAHALGVAVANLYGIRELRGTPTGFFSPDIPPTFRSVAIDHTGKTVDVFIGRFSIPGTDGYLETSAQDTSALTVRGQMKQKNMPKVRALLAETKRVLKAESIYKGKAFRVEQQKSNDGITFLDIEFINPTEVPAELMLNRSTMQLVQSGIWVPIRRTAQTRYFNHGAVKRGALLYGPPGTGKTLTALQTAREAYEHGWTFVYVKHVNQLATLYPFAVRYAPVVLYAEDIDLVMQEQSNAVNTLNNVLDGVDTKNDDIIVVLTTNYIETIPRTLLRPGRFHSVIEYAMPDRETAAGLVQQYASGQLDQKNYDAEQVGKALEGNIPATIAEVVQRAKHFAITRYPEDFRGSLKLTTADLVSAAHSMSEHLRLLNRPEEKNESAMQQFGNVIGEFLVRGAEEACFRLTNGGLRDDTYYGTTEQQESLVTKPIEPIIPQGKGDGGGRGDGRRRR